MYVLCVHNKVKVFAVDAIRLLSNKLCYAARSTVSFFLYKLLISDSFGTEKHLPSPFINHTTPNFSMYVLYDDLKWSFSQAIESIDNASVPIVADVL